MPATSQSTANQTSRNPELCIVIPCYNEEHGIDPESYRHFLSQVTDTLICFVDDGSTDNTLAQIQNITQGFESKTCILHLDRNIGKAEAVRQGFLHCNSIYGHKFTAFLDADLSTSLFECVEVSSYLDSKTNFVFGSRIMKIGSLIKRNPSRFLIGRILATLISMVLKLQVYDTQCGCKVFTKDLSNLLFRRRFISRWLFDVEIFYRMMLIYGYPMALNKMLEIPLRKWIDRGDSKVELTYFFKMWIDLFRIRGHYGKALKRLRLAQTDETMVAWRMGNESANVSFREKGISTRLHLKMPDELG